MGRYLQRDLPLFDLSKLHSFAFPAMARRCLVIDCVEDFKAFTELPQPYIILGEGSNTVFINDYPGTVLLIRLKGIEVEECENHYKVTVAAGENWHHLVTYLLEQQIYGLENLALIPGTVGAAPIQNIGAYGKEFAQYCHSVNCIDLKTKQQQSLSARECKFGYRDSIFKHEYQHQWLITEVRLTLPKYWRAENQYGELKALGDSPTAEDIYHKVIQIRSAKLPDPAVLGNAGSFFKNPVISTEQYLHLKQKWPNIPCYPVDNKRVKIPAAWLIDTLGFKGRMHGGVACHSQQPLVLVNQHQGTGEQLLALAQEIIHRVEAEFSIRLHNEVRLVEKGVLIEL